MILSQIFPKENIIVNLQSTEKDELFEELVEAIHSYSGLFDRKTALDSLIERESKMTTGIMHSVAIPHAQIPFFKGTVGAIGISREGIDYDSLDKAPVHLVFMIIGAEDETERHIQTLKQLASVLQIPGFVNKMIDCKTASDAYRFLCNSEDSLSD